MRKELSFMEAVKEAKKGKNPYFEAMGEKFYMTIGIYMVGVNKNERIVIDNTRNISPDEVNFKWYVDEPDETLSEKVLVGCGANSFTKGYKEEDVKEAITKFISWLKENDMVMDYKKKAKEIFGERLV